MRAAVYHRFGGPEVVEVREIPRPEPLTGEVLIKVQATTVSAADHRSRAKDLPAGLALPSAPVLGIWRPRRPVLGMDAAGVVAAVGAGVGRFVPGDEVVAMLGSRFGGHAEYAVADAEGAVARKPAGLRFEEAASIVFGGITVRAYLRQVPELRGRTVLVNGASGAVGSAVVQLARAAGAHVTGVSSAANQEMVTGLGAERTIDYAAHDFAADGSTYDLIVDCVGNAPLSRTHRAVNRGGAVLFVATDLRSLLTAKRNARKYGITVVTGPGPYRAEDLQHVLRLAEEGTLRPTIDRVYPLDEIVAAHRYVDSGRKRGSVVLRVAEPDRSPGS
jgi:NADPH:quinone reductase-like Zn-dependent oxidoreductase